MAIVTKSKDAPADAFHWSIPGAEFTLDDDHSEFETHDPAIITGLQSDPEFDVKVDEGDLVDVGVVDVAAEPNTPVADDVVTRETTDAERQWGDDN